MNILWLPKWTVQLGALALHEGERAPWYMGPAWYLPYTDRFVYMPMPINWIAASGRRVWLRLHKSELHDEIAESYRYGYNRGFEAGRDRGYDAGIRHTKMLFGATCGALKGNYILDSLGRLGT